MSEFKDLKLTQLVASSTNPRSEFEANSLNELANSIKSHGVLQPIIVRLHPEDSKKYEVVAGERRFRASVIAKLKTIPASIRELTDDEVFEIQIIENLERKDVHPMDEAVAFQRMLDSGKYSMEDIAAKVAKNTTFVAQRLKLNDLIPELKSEFVSGKFGIGHAVLLARVDSEQQKTVFEDHQDADGYPTLNDLKYELDDHDLEKAKFELTDSLLVPEAGPCSTCPKSSFGNPVLFPELETNKCFDSKCFENKEETFKCNEFQKIIDENSGIVITCRWGLENHPKLQKIAEDNGKSILTGYDSFNMSLKNEENKIKSFSIYSWDFQDIILTEVGKTTNSENPELNISTEIANIKQRAERALELDREKIMQRIQSEIIEKENNILLENDLLNEEEIPAFLMALYENGNWEFTKWIKERFDLVDKSNYNTTDFYDFFKTLRFSQNDINEIFRSFIIKNLVSKSTLDFGKSSTAKAVYEYVNFSYPKEIELYTLEQNDIAAKRINKSDQKIADLQESLSN